MQGRVSIGRTMKTGLKNSFGVKMGIGGFEKTTGGFRIEVGQFMVFP